MSRFVHFELAVYLPPGPSGTLHQPMRILTDALHNFPDLTLVSDLPKDPQTMMIRAKLNENVRSDYVPPSLDSLRYFGHGLSTKQAEWLQESTEALVLQFAHPQKDVWTGLQVADELVSEIATNTEGLVWDEETREIFTPQSWRKLRIDEWTEPPRVSRHTLIHEYNTGHSVRAITLGMAKMGLPDVVVEDTGWSSSSQLGSLINLVTQALAEGQPLTRSGDFKLVLEQIKNSEQRNEILESLKVNAARIGCLTLVKGRWEDGDPRSYSAYLRQVPRK